MNTSVIVIIAVFVCFLALLGGAALVGFIWFLVGLNRRLESVAAALGPLTSNGSVQQSMLAVIGIANAMPDFSATLKAMHDSFAAFASFALGKQEPPNAAPPFVRQPNPNPKPTDATGEFIPPPPEAEVINEAMKEALRQQGIELDPNRVPEPRADQIVQAQV